jgi:hypothetical protein
MNIRRTAGLLLATALASISLAAAQTPSQSDTTAPDAASSPHQRSSTSSPAPETAPTNGADPASAATPHQKKATDAKVANAADAKETLKGCIAREQADHTGMTMADAKKSCKTQLKVNNK